MKKRHHCALLDVRSLFTCFCILVWNLHWHFWRIQDLILLPWIRGKCSFSLALWWPLYKVSTGGPWATRFWATRFWATRIFGKMQRNLSNAILYYKVLKTGYLKRVDAFTKKNVNYFFYFSTFWYVALIFWPVSSFIVYNFLCSFISLC